MNSDEKLNEAKLPVLERSYSEDFKSDVQEATDKMAAEIALWKAFWEEWIPGGLRRRKRYRTAGHGLRRLTRHKKNRVARIARRANRRAKKRRR